MSEQQGQESKFFVYLEGLGCFVFVIGLGIGFIFLAATTYRKYTQNKSEPNVERESERSSFTKAPEKKRNTPKKVDPIAARKSEVLFVTFVEEMRGASSKEQVYKILDYFVRNIAMTESDKERMTKFAEQRIKQFEK